LRHHHPGLGAGGRCRGGVGRAPARPHAPPGRRRAGPRRAGRPRGVRGLHRLRDHLARLRRHAAGPGDGRGARRRDRRPGRAALGWAGLAAIVASGVWFTSATMWPGYAATLPTLGTAAVIAGGFAGQRGGPGLLIDNRPMRWIGGLSYSLYLWHWPLIVVAAE